MKKTLLILLGGILFSILFNRQGIGVNVILYSIFIVGNLFVFNPDKLVNRHVWISSLLLILNAFAVYLHRSSIASLFYGLSLLVCIGTVAEHQSSVLVAWLNGLVNLILGVFIPSTLDHKSTQKDQKEWRHLFKLVIFPIVFISLFVLLYQHANPIITNFIQSIHIDHYFVFFAILGAAITANVSSPKPTLPLTTNDIVAIQDLIPSKSADHQSTTNEMQLGIISLITLNLLLLVVLITEIFFLININEYSVVELSKAVHQGIYSSIASIVFAIVVIVYFFRGDINFLKENRLIKQMAYIWIVLNTFLCVTVCLKNSTYILDYGLTHKRLGVMVYILLCIMGLFFTYVKIKEKKNTRFLWVKNTQYAYYILFVYALFNWSAIITRYNLSHQHINLKSQDDIEFLKNMLPQNIAVLQDYEVELLFFSYVNLNNETIYKIYSYDELLERYNLDYESWQEQTGIAKKVRGK